MHVVLVHLQACLKAIYITWVSYDTKLHPPLEPLIIDVLTNMHLPEINCLPVKKQFGSLRELILYPIFEESSLPYTSDAAIKLLRSVGRYMYMYMYTYSGVPEASKIL